MAEKQYKELLIATIKMSEHEEKKHIISLLKLVAVSFQKEFAFTYIFHITEKSILSLALLQKKFLN